MMLMYAAVFAGGQSSRMGRNKALMTLGDMSLLERAECLLQDSGVDEILLSGNVPGRADSIPDRLPQQGPPAALYSVVSCLAEREQGLNGRDSLLVIPVDMPGLSPPVLHMLVQAMKAPTGRALKAVHYEGEVFPCVFRLDAALLDFLHSGLVKEARAGEMVATMDKHRRFSMKRIFTGLAARALPTAGLDQRVFANVNTPEDWQRFTQDLL